MKDTNWLVDLASYVDYPRVITTHLICKEAPFFFKPVSVIWLVVNQFIGTNKMF